jgi:hypothetical protein
MEIDHMKTKMRALAALAGSAVVALIAFPALAEGSFCDSEESECPSGPPQPPPQPQLPGNVSANGNYFVALGTIQNQQYQQGTYVNGHYFYSGSGPTPLPIPGDGRTLTIGTTNNYISMAPTLSPLGAVSVNAVALTPQDPNFPGFDIVARGSLSLSYLVDLHANSQAAADALTSLLTTSGAIAHIDGDYSLTATGASWGSVAAFTGTNELGAGLGGVFSSACSLINYSGTPSGCASGSYDLALNFVNGSTYSDSTSWDFISMITLSASANAGPPDLGYMPGTLSAYIDPMITFGPDIDISQYTLSVGGVDSPLISGAGAGGVPEPAAWAMMLVGFGGLGAVLRRRRQVALAI